MNDNMSQPAVAVRQTLLMKILIEAIRHRQISQIQTIAFNGKHLQTSNKHFENNTHIS